MVSDAAKVAALPALITTYVGIGAGVLAYKTKSKSSIVAVPAACVVGIATAVFYGITCCAIDHHDDLSGFQKRVKMYMLNFGITATLIAGNAVFLVYIMNSKKHA